jgi:hypothetical protein
VAFRAQLADPSRSPHTQTAAFSIGGWMAPAERSGPDGTTRERGRQRGNVQHERATCVFGSAFR